VRLTCTLIPNIDMIDYKANGVSTAVFRIDIQIFGESGSRSKFLITKNLQ
jgi:hypothetical protein